MQAAALRTSVLSTTPRTSPTLASTPLVMVNTVKDLLSLSLALSNTTEFAVDLEMNNTRSYNGLTCLIQISTRTTDYIIDALQLWDAIHFHLAPLFQNPGIVKIFHSCSGGDVPALHRDFNIYCINVFDTQIAAQMHIGRQVSLEFLLTDYLIPSCLPSKKISALKSTWTCTDWRQRPLPIEAILYARMDTHYLIELKERLVLDMCGGHEESRSTLHDEMDSALMAAAAFGKSMDGTLARRVPVFIAPPDSSSEEEEGEGEGKGKRKGEEHHTKTTSAALIGSSDVQEDELCHCLFLSHKCSTSTFRAKKRPVQLLKKDKWYKRCCKQWRRTKEKKEVLYSMLFQWRDTIARTHDECSHYVCPSEILVCLTKKVPRNGAALTQTWTPLPPLLATVAVQESLFQVIQQWASEHQVVEDGERKTNQDTRNSNLLLALPSHLWKLILAFFGYKDYTLTGRTCQYLRRLWTEELNNHHIAGTLFVPVDCNTLKEAVDRVHEEDRLTTIVVGQGEHQIAGSYLVITSAMNIVGDPGVPKEEIVVVAGIAFKPRKRIQGNFHLQHLTLRGTNWSGVVGRSSFTMNDVRVEQCGGYGVGAQGTGVVGRCTNLEVRQCGQSGVAAANGASITLIGAETTVHHNCTEGESNEYGLTVHGSLSSTVQLISPLTKEQVAIDNGGSSNWGARDGGDINQIKTITKAEMTAVLARASASASRIDALSKQIIATGTLVVNVPEECDLNEAVKVVHLVNKTTSATDRRIITIVVGRGNHQIDGAYPPPRRDAPWGGRLQIFSTMNIVGDPEVPKEQIVVLGGISFEKGIQGNCRLQNMSLYCAKENGVAGESSFTMEDVIVQSCGGDGVWAVGTGVVGRCINVKVSQSEGSGMVASSGATITLIGAETTVNINCLGDWGEHNYGLKVEGSFSTIQLVSPLTKEQVSLDHGEGGNWGADDGWEGGTANINQIKTIAATTISSSSSSVAAAGAPGGETKSNHFDYM